MRLLLVAYEAEQVPVDVQVIVDVLGDFAVAVNEPSAAIVGKAVQAPVYVAGAAGTASFSATATTAAFAKPLASARQARVAALMV